MIRPATAAYRLDLRDRPNPFGDQDGTWVTVANLLEQAASLGNPHAEELIREAIELAGDAIGSDRVTRLAQREWGLRERASSEIVLLLSDDAALSGALHTARSMLHGLLEADESLSSVQRGRVLARMARIDGKLGLMDEAADEFRQVGALGRKHDSAELEVLAWIGLGALAQMRGNYPELQRFALRAARLADRTELRHLSRFAHSGLMIAAGARGELDRALSHAGIVYRASVGDPTEEGEILQNIGQLMLETGNPDLAERAFAAVLSRTLPVRIVLAALGGLGLASAKIGHAASVRWAAAEVERLAAMGAPHYQVATALLECGIALSAFDDAGVGERLRSIALAIGQAHGFHEVVIKAEAAARESVTASSRVQSLGRKALKLANEIREREPEELPEHVMTVAVSG